MFINRVESYFVDGCRRAMKRVTTYGKYKDTNIVIDNYNYKGKTIGKRFVAWGDTWQKIVNKVRGKDGKFKSLGQWLDVEM